MQNHSNGCHIPELRKPPFGICQIIILLIFQIDVVNSATSRRPIVFWWCNFCLLLFSISTVVCKIQYVKLSIQPRWNNKCTFLVGKSGNRKWRYRSFSRETQFWLLVLNWCRWTNLRPIFVRTRSKLRFILRKNYANLSWFSSVGLFDNNLQNML